MRRFSSPQQPETPKPDLEKVLAHYGAVVHRSGMYSCLWHEDKTPSMSVDLRKGLVNCHSCGWGGDSWKIIMEKESVDFRGARERALGATFLTEEEVARGSDTEVQHLHYAGGRTVARGKGHREGRCNFRPAWRSSD